MSDITKDERIVQHARDMCKLWKIEKDNAGGDQWKNREARQAYHDALMSMKRWKLIEDYHLTEGWVVVDGVKYTEDTIVTQFVPTQGD